MPPVVGILIAYLLGGIPAAYLAGRLVKGIDLRRHGSGNLGATNVYRVLGAKAAVPVFLFDIAKGAAAVAVLPRLTGSPHAPVWALAYGLAAIVGHMRSPYLGWSSGGKGVATALGVFVALVPWATLTALAAWIAVFALSRIVSLASLASAVVLPLAIVAFDGVHSPVFFLSLVVSLAVIWMHRANIDRLRHGEEHRVGHGRTAA
ncbi:MAG TPA: glycerol-3-phosphate 1-O-acyltransferase PlsY [Gemmatimonadaceae bacterium]|jgi:glycerol-3-phosphate acyltransferase PlsY|nr:glycerol-3-phosphate 1-O-acyltransferase PlsY [Gemmatimonadaceae bacterium]